MRYEFREGSSSKFWEARVDGAQLITTWGRIGTAGQSKTKKFKDAAAATKEHDALVTEKTRKGYRSTGAQQTAAAPPLKTVSARDEKLEAAILADRAPEQAWLVYADFLQDQGDPRGELAALQARPKLSAAANKLLWDRRDHFFGPLSPMLAPFDKEHRRAVTATWRHGFIDTLRLSAQSGSSSTRSLKEGKRPPVLLCTLGHPRLAHAFAAKKLPERFRAMPAYVYNSKFEKRNKLFDRLAEEKIPKALDKAALGVLDDLYEIGSDVLLKDGQSPQGGYHSSASLDEVKASLESDGFQVVMVDDVSTSVPDVDGVDELVALLAKVDSVRLLRELRLGAAEMDGRFDFGSAIKALVKSAPSLQSLERIFIGDFTYEACEISWSSLGNAAPLYKAFPRLKSLTLRSGKMTLGSIEHSALEELTVITGGLTRQSLSSITEASLPKLHTLNVWFGGDGYGGNCRLEDIEALLESPVLANVKHLGLQNCTFGDEVVARLAKSKLLPRLESLDISKSHLTQAAVDTITANAKVFSKLARLDVSNAILPKASARALKAVVKDLEFGRQDPDWWGLAEGMRYAAVGE